MRRLLFEEEELQHDPVPSDVSVSAAAPLKKKREKLIKETPESEALVRRSTRQSVKRDGFKLEPMRDKVTPPKKKPKSTKPRIPKPTEKDNAPPHTPMSTPMKVGTQLEIPEDEMTVESLWLLQLKERARWLSTNNKASTIYFGPSVLLYIWRICFYQSMSSYILYVELMPVPAMDMCIRPYIGLI
jgi:hypothetical protein